MNRSKILMTALAVMLVFAFASVASAGSGLTANDPIEVLYVGWAWEYEGWGSGESMGHVPGAEYNVPINTQFSRVILNEDEEEVTYYFNHTYIALDMMNTSTVPQSVINEVEKWSGSVSLKQYHKTADIVVVDMFFGNLTNQWNPDFVNAFGYYNKSNTHLVSVFAEEIDYTTMEPVQSWAPSNFEVRDLSAFTTLATNFSNAWFVGLYQSEANSENAGWGDYMTICDYIASHV